MSEPTIVTGVMSPMTAKNMRPIGTSTANATGEAIVKVQVELPAASIGLTPPKLLSEDPVVCASETHEQALTTARWFVNNLDKVPHSPGWDGVLAMAYIVIEKLGGSK